MKKLYHISILTLIAFVFVYSCSTEEEDNTPPPSIVATPEPEPETPAPTQYTLTVTAGEGGTVSTEGGTYDEGTEVTITATPDEGYEFVGWEGNDTNESSLSININQDISLIANFVISQSYSLIGEEYSNINKLTSYYSTQKTNRYLSQDDIFNKINFVQQIPNVYWRTSVRTVVIDDFDKNGSLDVFGFWFKSTPDYEYGSIEPGRYFLYNDFFTDNPKEPIYWDTELAWSSVLYLADLNGDGQNEIISFNDNNHDARVWEDQGNISSDYPIEIVSLDTNLNFSKRTIGPEAKSHDGSLGDVDGDGDIDILFLPFNDEVNKFPVLYRNDGAANFTPERLFINESLSIEFSNFYTLSYEVFDFNNDGNLDLIASSKPNIKREYYYFNPPAYFESNQNVEIFWGNGTGNFDIKNKTIFNVENNFDYDFSVIGYGFSDYDYDGDVDVFITTTRAEEWRLLGISNVTIAVNSGLFYNNYIIYGFKNENNNFIDVSESIFDINKDLTLTKYSNFYSIYFMDLDNDGDYDLIPGNNHIDTEYSQLSLLYWENTGGQFERREND